MNTPHHLQVYRGIINQQGYGLGSIFAKLFRAARPFLQSGAKYAARKAVKTGYHTLNDIIDGVPAKDAFQTNVRKLGDTIKSDVKKKVHQVIKGRGIKRKRGVKNVNTIKKKRKRVVKYKQAKNMKKKKEVKASASCAW